MTQNALHNIGMEEEERITILPHPLGIKPAGNGLLATDDIKLAAGFFVRLPDELIVHILEFLQPEEILGFRRSCKAILALCLNEETWKTKYIECSASASWKGSWFETVLGKTFVRETGSRRFQCNGLYSDLLYKPWECLKASLRPHEDIRPNNYLPRIDQSNASISPEDFREKWIDRPFVATKLVGVWKIMETWNTENFRRQYGAISFSCGPVDWQYETFCSYMDANEDESPLYLFDSAFVEKMKLRVGRNLNPQGDYWVPECFDIDFFEVLGDKRPEYRWLIAGPERSGSTMHKDPNGTSAWNAVITGAKYWILLPPDSIPPGVVVSKDQATIQTPLTIYEWLKDHLAEARNIPGCKEGVCHPGELVYVPAGWYHLVLNLKPSIAITQNFVTRKYLPDTLGFMKYKPEQVSGFKSDVTNPYQTFITRLRQKYPEVLDQALQEMEKKYGPKKRKWDQVTRTDNEITLDGETPNNKEQTSFSFSFNNGCEGSEEDIP